MKKSINILIDNIDPVTGIKDNITNTDEDTFSVLKSMFRDANLNYYASGTLFAYSTEDRQIENWIYPIIIHNLTFINFMFDWGATDKDIIALLPPMVRQQYFQGRGTIVIIIKEPFQTMTPKNNDLKNFIKMIKDNPRYNNVLFLTLHYIDSPNFMFANVVEEAMKDWGPTDGDRITQTYNLLENYKNRRFLCLNTNYRESSERLFLLSFLENYNMLDEGFVSALGYPNDKLIDNIDIVKGLSKSLLNIIPEGNFDRRGYHFITEKSYRSFLHKKPFIYLGQYEGLKFIRSMGYKTFSPIINESYDNIDNDKLRAATVCKEIKRLVDKPIEDFVKDMSQLQDICEHNYKVYVSSKANFKDKFYKKIYGTNNANFKN